jgi:hypothetical protein
MNQQPRQASQSRVTGLLGGPPLACILTLLFALTLVAIALLMLCGALIWQNPLISVGMAGCCSRSAKKAVWWHAIVEVVAS